MKVLEYVTLISCALMILINSYKTESKPISTINIHKAIPHKSLQISTDINIINGDYMKWKQLLAERESSNKWDTVNTLGYIGLYQFGKIALTDVNMSIDVNEFIKDPSIFDIESQNIAMDRLVKNNKKYLRKYIKKYVGKTINGILITESGLLAAAHLVGNGTVKQWLKSDGQLEKTDSFGTSIEEYLIKFSNYTI